MLSEKCCLQHIRVGYTQMTHKFRKVRVQMSRVKHINVHKTSRLVYIGNKLNYAYN